MTRKTLPILGALLTVAALAGAQDSVTLATYQFGVPAGDTRDFIDRTSFRGFGIDVRRFVGDDERMSVGGSASWNVFDSGAIADTITVRTEELNGDISGTQFRYVNAIPLMANFFYYFGDPGSTHAYVGTGAGLIYTEQRLEFGLSAFEKTSWRFGLTPEVGAMVPVGDSSALNFAVRYHLGAVGATDLSGDDTRFDYVTFNVGFGFYSDIF